MFNPPQFQFNGLPISWFHPSKVLELSDIERDGVIKGFITTIYRIPDAGFDPRESGCPYHPTFHIKTERMSLVKFPVSNPLTEMFMPSSYQVRIGAAWVVDYSMMINRAAWEAMHNMQIDLLGKYAHATRQYSATVGYANYQKPTLILLALDVEVMR